MEVSMAPYPLSEGTHLQAILLIDLASHVELRIQSKKFDQADEALTRLIFHANELRTRLWRETHISGMVGKYEKDEP